jgi:hypothetical protein
VLSFQVFLFVVFAFCAHRHLVFAELLINDELVEEEAFHKLNVPFLTSNSEALVASHTSPIVVVNRLLS